MATEYKYKGIFSSHHVWTSSQPEEPPGFYFRHVADEENRLPLIKKFKDLGFTEEEIKIILGQEILYGPKDFSTREYRVDYPYPS